jgi:acyl-coenzyme A thioesterase PaaI-like protein
LASCSNATNPTTSPFGSEYVGATKRSNLVYHGRTVRRRRELVLTKITATDSDGTVVAHAVQTYRIA